MEFDDHVCITTLTGDLRLLAESKKKLADLITKNRPWEAQDSGDYFGYPVQKPTPFVPPPKGGIWRSLFNVTGRGNVDDDASSRHSSNYPGPSSPAPSTAGSSYHTATADSPAGSVPPSPVVESPTPRSATSSITVPHIHTNLLRTSDPPQSSSGESMGSLHSMFHTRYAIKTYLKLLTYRMYEVLTVVTLHTPKCTWNLAQKRMKVCSQCPSKTMHLCCPCYRLLE